MTDGQLGDLMIFITIVAVVVVVGYAIGMIVAGRLDRLMAASRPAEDAESATPAAAESGAAAPSQEEQQA